MIRKKWEAPDLKRAAREFWAKHKSVENYPLVLWGALREMPIEDKASGTGLIQELKRGETVDGYTHDPIPVRPIERVKDKLTRVMDVVSYIDSGFVCLLEGAPYVSDFISECEAFTADDSHAFDDQIDPMCDAIVDMIGRKKGGFFS
jgi:predicted phage terminase large subunit-like protein